MVWYDVDIGGITPVWVLQEAEINPEAHTIKLRCAAIQEFLGADPQTEIDNLNALASLGEIKNEGLVNLGTKLFTSNYITFVINNRTYTKCALHPIVTVIDEYYAGPDLGSVLEYEVNIEYEADGLGGSAVYIAPKYPTEYPELDYHFYYDYRTGETWDQPTTGLNYGTEGGIWTFTLTDKQIKRVECYGSGDLDILGTGRKPYIECNRSDQMIWSFYEAQDGVKLKQLQKFIWDLDTSFIVGEDADTGATTIIPLAPVNGGILDNTVLTLDTGTGPATITVDGDHAHLSDSLTVDAISDDIIAGAVYVIDRHVVVLSTNQKVPDETHIPINITANADSGGTEISITPLNKDVSDGHIFYKVSGTGPSQIVVDGYHTAGDGSITVDPLSENLVAGAVYKMTVNLGCYLEWIRLVYE
jgi:hypothetical protein